METYDQKVAGIVLAAGASTRMGTAKQLLPVAGVTLVERALTAALESRLDRLVLVLGHHAHEIETALGPMIREPKLTLVHNHRYKEGISSSLVAGVGKIDESHDHAMILLADMPFIDRQVINFLMERYLASQLPIGAIRAGGRAAHPVIFRRDLYPELKHLTGDVGARSLLEKYRDRVCLATPGTGYDGRDIDDREDYRSFQLVLEERNKTCPIS